MERGEVSEATTPMDIETGEGTEPPPPRNSEGGGATAPPAPPADAPRAKRPWLVLFLRLGLSIGMLGVLLWRMPKFSVEHLLPKWGSDTAFYLVVAALLTL